MTEKSFWTACEFMCIVHIKYETRSALNPTYKDN